MLLNFDSFNFINESVSLKEIKPRGRYLDMKKGFFSKGYEFLGNISLSGKSSNAFSYDEISNVVPDELWKKLDEFDGCGYVSHTMDKRYLNSSIWGVDEVKRLLSILSEPNTEKISSCTSKNNDIYYVLWNEEHKYFYFIGVKSSFGFNDNGVTGFLEMFIKIRKNGLDIIEKEVDEVYSRCLEDKSIKDREWNDRENTRKTKILKEKEYQRRVDTLKSDVEAHPEDYKEVREEELPGNIRDAINSDDYMDTPYVVYVKSGLIGPDDFETVTCYVNDDDFSDGYKFTRRISHKKRNRYYGD